MRYNEPASQIDMLRKVPSPKLVTVSLGGNDTGFPSIIVNCITIYAVKLLNQGQGPTCQQYYTNADGSNQVSNTIAGLRVPMFDALTDVRNAVSPDTTVVVMTYPAALSLASGSCSLLDPMDMSWFTDLTHQLDQTVIAAANAAGVQHLDEEYALQGHEMCTSQPWVQAPGLAQDPSVKNNYFHPLTPGYTQEAHDLKDDLWFFP